MDESRAADPARQADAREVLVHQLMDAFGGDAPGESLGWQRAAETRADKILAALAAAGLAVVSAEEHYGVALMPRDPTEKAGTCHACQREVDHVRGSMWHGEHRICKECFMQWYDPDHDDVNPTSPRSVGNATRRKLGLPLLEGLQAEPR